jgi:cobalt-precorrin 5A hydrolase
MSRALAWVTFSSQGLAIVRRLQAAGMAGDLYLHVDTPCDGTAQRFDRIMDLMPRLFAQYTGIVFIGPCGVAVRAAAPCLKNKHEDPAVVLVDVGGRFAVSLLGGHEGGANTLTLEVANALGSEPVITTTTEAVKTVTVGVGCRRGTPADRIVAAVHEALTEADVKLEEVRWMATAMVKRDEAGLVTAARMLALPLRILPDWLLWRGGPEVTPSEFVEAIVNVPAVAEPAALTSGRNTVLLLKRKIYDGVTVAVARENCW